jgi:hypothetical protein
MHLKCGDRRPKDIIESPDDKTLTVPNCPRAYQTHGHVESVFKVSLPEEQDGEDARTELRYAPYFSMLDNRGVPEVGQITTIPPHRLSSRAQDLVPITDYFQNSTAASYDEEYINITMQLSYRGVGALQASLADRFIPYNSPRTNTSEREPLPVDTSELLRECKRYTACAPVADPC